MTPLPPLNKKQSNNRHKKVLNLWKRRIGLESLESDFQKQYESPFNNRLKDDNGYYHWYVRGVDPITGDVLELVAIPNRTGRIGLMIFDNLGTRDEFLGEGCGGDHIYTLSFTVDGMAKDLVTNLTTRKSLGLLRRDFGGYPFRKKSVKLS